jgi:hypothetical protein
MLYEPSLAERTPDSSPFAEIYRPKATPKPQVKKKNRGPIRTKEEWAIISLETELQRKARQKAEREAKILCKNKYSEVGISTREAGNRAAQIRTAGVC